MAAGGGHVKNLKSLLPQESQDRGAVLERILNIPNLERVVPRLQPDLLYRVIQNCGLEDCGELALLTTPEQLTRIFDLDLWRSVHPGSDEHFDADRFGVWLEVLAEFGGDMAAQKLAEIEAEIVIAGLAQHIRVLDFVMVTSYTTTDGSELTSIGGLDPELACEVGGCKVVARRTESWDAIVAILVSLEAKHPDYFRLLMRGCRALSNSSPERDGLHDLLAEDHQIMFDLAFDRERRRDEQGHVTPAQARAFLKSSRQIPLGSEAMPPANAVATAYLRSLDQIKTATTLPRHLPATTGTIPAADPVESSAAFVNVLLEAGIIAQQPRALLNGPQEYKALGRMRVHMQFVFDCDDAAYARRSEELTFLANAIMAGCSLVGTSFTAQKAWDAATATCNLGLENWPHLWNPAKSLPNNFLVDHDLVAVFQVGWTVLHNDVTMYAAQQLLEILGNARCDDRNIQNGLDELRTQLSTCCRTGAPWLARDALDVIAIIDMPAWAALLGLIDQCPVFHAALNASRNPRTCSVSSSAFEFISENSQITFIHEFVRSLPEILRL